MLMYLSLVLMLIVLTITLGIIIRFTFLINPRVMHNRCHTDSLEIRDLHGHTEPHV
jgi:hypothetical protein